MRSRRPRRFRFHLGRALFVLPNLFTCSSIFCGFFAIVRAGGQAGPTELYHATLAIFFAIFFDMADGRVARLTRTQSEFGVQLDSLADVISFGVAPAVIVYHWALAPMALLGALGAFVYIACGALRLARFNVLAARAQPEPSSHFVGLPIPLAAGVLASVVMVHQRTAAMGHVEPTRVLWLVFALGALMISNVRYRTFKDIALGGRSLLGFAVLMAAFVALARLVEPSFACLTFFCTYVLLGLVEQVLRFGRRRGGERARTAAAGAVDAGPDAAPPARPLGPPER